MLLWVCFLDVSILRYITKVLLLFRTKICNGKWSECQTSYLVSDSNLVFSLFVFFVVVVFNLLTWQILTWSWWALISSCALWCVKSFCLTDTSVCPFCSAVDTRYANVPSPIIQFDHAQVNIDRFWCEGGSRVLWSRSHVQVFASLLVSINNLKIVYEIKSMK